MKDVKQIEALFKKGMAIKTIAYKFGVTRQAIWWTLNKLKK